MLLLFWLVPVGGAPSDVLLAGPFEPDRFRKLPMPDEIPCAILVRLALRAGGFLNLPIELLETILIQAGLEPKLFLLVCYLAELLL